MKKILSLTLILVILATGTCDAQASFTAPDSSIFPWFPGDGSFPSTETEPEPYEPKLTEITYTGGGWSSIGSCTINWELTPGDNGCAGIEVIGKRKNGTQDMLADLSPDADSYTITGEAAFGYYSFTVRAYVMEGDARKYESEFEEKNNLYTDGYFLSDGIVGVKTPTRAQIKKMYKKLSPKNQATKYSKKPNNKKPYGKGAVSDGTLKNGLNTLNFIRYVAGIPSDVKIKKSYQSKAQAAAVVNYNDKSTWISHYPQKPAGMNKALYKEGAEGASSSNIAAGMGTLYDAIASGWVSDSDAYNIDRLGHRRWCLNPSMKYTGFGIDDNIYTMYSFDKSGKTSGIHGVHWPAANTPVQFFSDGDAWNISMGTAVQDKNVKVTLTRKKDNKKWTFTTKKSRINGNFMAVENSGYGQTGCIIFRPKSIHYKKGDKFTVTVSGSGFSFTYDVTFFSL